MPSIEIISLNSTKLKLNSEKFEFALIIENGKLESHRSLYFDFLKKLNGTIIHIGNPEFKNDIDSGFFGGKLIDWNKELKNDFKFLPEYENDFKKLLNEAQLKSPDKSLLFLTDYQFSRRKPKIVDKLTLDKFLNLYEKKGLEFNRLYKITN